ncbi:MAG TPA: hypothetical protein VGQ57_00430, partial [Polyangiaceae bacterium]|nr:hypothetical protein [Polyangiaceae bacterium]
MNARRLAVRRALPLALMAASGFAGLGYQIVWTEQCSLALGHDSAAVLAVVTAFLGGLGLGGIVLGAPIERSLRPLRWYAACELVVAAWSLALSFVAPAFHDVLGRAIGFHASPGRQWVLAFLGTFGLFLPATAAMGAALPAMERLTHELERRGRSIAGLYAANTFGAVLGVLVAAFWWVPALGLRHTAAACSGLNLGCAVLALAALPSTAPPAAPAPPEPGARAGVVKLAVTGFLGIGYEVLVVRVLSQLTEDTVYTFALLLAVYLFGSAFGAAA